MKTAHPILAVVTRQTRLAGLKARWATGKAAAFRLHQAAEHEIERRRQRFLSAGYDLNATDELELAEAADALADHDAYEEGTVPTNVL